MSNQGLREEFSYDALNRVTAAQVQGQSGKVFTYDASGNLTSKSGVGAYTYGEGSAGPHAVTSVSGALNATYTYDANGSMVSGAGRTLEYLSNNKPWFIDDAGRGVSSRFSYGPGQELLRAFSKESNGHSESTTYMGLFERVEESDNVLWDPDNPLTGDPSAVEERCYIVAGGGTAAVITSWTVGANPPTVKTRYFHGDHLGSTEVVSTETGTVAERFSYDAWGLKRNADSTDAASQEALKGLNSERGFTGHHQLDHLGLVHMGGRVYDPLLGRMMQADPIVQAPQNGQNYNRYSYVINNPLSLTDPSGYSFFGDVFKAVGGFFSKVFDWHVKAAKAVGRWLQKNWKQVVVVAAAVAASVVTFGALAPASLAAAGAMTQGFIAAAAGGAAGGFVSGALGTALYGGSVSQVLVAGLRGAAIGAAQGALTFGIGHLGAGGSSIFHGLNNAYLEAGAKALAHGLVQGAASTAHGGRFLDGFIGGALSSLGGSALDWKGPTGKGVDAMAIRAAVMGAAGGTAAELTGGDFANGAIAAAYVQMFNDYFDGVLYREDRRSEKDTWFYKQEIDLWRGEIVDVYIDFSPDHGITTDVWTPADLSGAAIGLGKLTFSFGKTFAAKGLTTPSKYFGNKTAQEVSEAMTKKFGPPKSVREGAETFYNPKTQRSFNVHTDPAHGPPHVDVRRRGGYPEQKYPLAEGQP